MKALPIGVVTENVRIGTVFRKIIQAQVSEMPIEEENIYEFGWHERKFHWLEDKCQNISRDREYGASLKVGTLLAKGDYTIIPLILAMVHGSMGGILRTAGIHHDFVTFVYGPTGVGKTALAKKTCAYLKHKPNVLALSSDRKEIRRLLQNSADMTMVVDDFNTSSSDRIISRQLQIVSEIIQAACDAGSLIIDASSIEKVHNGVHIVVTSETIIRNVSTMNRCFLVNMQENIPDNLWNEISAMEEQNVFFVFMQSFIRYVEENYDAVVSNCRDDFSYYKWYACEKILFAGASINRIAETLAVQYTLKKQLLNYMEAVGIDTKLHKRAGGCMDECIASSGQDLQNLIADIARKKSHMELLPALAFIVSGYGGDVSYFLAEDEAKYQKKIRNGNTRYVGFQKNMGYISFSPSHMCQLIANFLEKDNISVNCLGKELSYYHLAYVEGSEQKQSCRWHTEKKYYHVNYRQLLELVNSVEYGEESGRREELEWKIRRFEEAYLRYSDE